MDKIERVTAVLEGRPPDRPPVSFWHHFAPEEQAGQAAVEAHLRHLNRFDLDFLKVMNDHGCPGAGSGLVGSAVPLTPGVKGVRTNADSLKQLRDLPEWSGQEPEFAGQYEVLADLARHLKGRVLISTTIFNSWATMRRLYQPPERRPGPPVMEAAADPISAKLLEMIDQDADAVASALDRVAHGLARFAAGCIEAGADGVFLSVRDDWLDGADGGRRKLYDRFVRPGDLRILSAVGGGRFNLLHVCGTAVDFAAFAEYPVQAIHWADRAAGPAIREVAGTLEPAACGGVDNLVTLPQGTPADCAAEVADALTQAGDRPMLIAPGCTYDPDRVPEANLRAVCEAVRSRR